GSGVVIDEEGYVLTNIHVVDGADEIWVKLWDDRPPIRATPLAGATSSDLALLKLEKKPGEKFQSIKMAVPDDVLLGETVLALGNPFGLGGSVSRGILSSTARRINPEAGPLEIPDWLQTDAAINPGNSGGPLINLRGEMIGINVAVSREGQGIGFAIPIKRVWETLQVLFTPEISKERWFGARFMPGTNSLAVLYLDRGSPAANAGLAVGDQITAVNGKSPRNFIEANELIAAAIRDEVSLSIRRAGQPRGITVRMLPIADQIKARTGLTVQPMTPDLAGAMGLDTVSGLLIADVEKGSPAQLADLKKGYLIANIDGMNNGGKMDILNAAQYLGGKPAGERVKLTVLAQIQRGSLTTFRQGSVDLKIR
ncbi:MAG: trypsin-like peptidase domain-containing protein, partial [Opitutaceae bacterium]|nr:trypsin-like peptidase domain-containing protein [Verrucomicrobiales bacterium]